MKNKLYYCKSCGAVGIDDGTNEIKWVSDVSTLNEITGLNVLESEIENATVSFWGCDHCINRWGIDLCSCGSGEKVRECACGSNQPSQVYKQKTRIQL